MSDLPCKNPNCKSFGTPHPHCKCYGDMAKGGEAGFCSEERNHDPRCQYFQDGGEALDPSQVVPDEHAEIPNDQVTIDESSPGQEVPHDQVSQDSDYETPGQMLATAAEGAARGVAGLLAPYLETAAGVPKEDIASRARVNAGIHGTAEVAGLVGSNFIPGGQLRMVGKAAEAAAHFADLGKFGSAVIKGAISNGLIQGSDEVSKWLIGDGDPTNPVGAALVHTGAASLFGGALGGAGTGAAAALKKVAETKAANKVLGILAGMGAAAKTPLLDSTERNLSDAVVQSFFEQGAHPEGMSYENFKSGQKIFDSVFSGAIKGAAPGLGALVGKADIIPGMGESTGFLLGKMLEKHINPIVEKIAAPFARNVLAPIALKVASSGNTSGLFDILDHAANVSAGYKTLTKGLESLFSGTAIKAENLISDKAVDKLKKYIEDGGFNQEVQKYYQDNQEVPQFAEGGPVSPPEITSSLGKENGVVTHYPAQNMLLNAAKGRVSNYLNSIRPLPQPKLPFDHEADNKDAHRKYDKALKIALKPLSVLDEVSRGTIDQTHITHLNGMYPEVGSLLQKEITNHILKKQLSGDKPPPAKIRQGLSLLMGTPLSSEYTPQNIQAAQAVFAQKTQSPGAPPVTKNKKNTSTLSKSEKSFLTGTQAREMRQQRLS